MDTTVRASQFYTGLVADLYDPLVSERARADEYTAFLDRSGTPALELCCGSGLPMVELAVRGYAVEGLDSSRDMLDRCRARAAAEGVDVRLHHAEMQSFSLGRSYRSIFLAGASFTLLTSDDDARKALERIYAHLEPGGGTLIPLETLDAEAMRRVIGHFRELDTGTGERLRVGMVSFEVSEDGRDFEIRLRYERFRGTNEPEIVERDWQRRWWSQEQFGEMLRDVGFESPRLVARGGGAAKPDATVFVALARRPKP